MAYGYSIRLIELNKKADPKLIGVRLGKLCISNKVPVSQVAERLNVSRQTVYNWFCGVSSPHGDSLAKVRDFIATLA